MYSNEKRSVVCLGEERRRGKGQGVAEGVRSGWNWSLRERKCPGDSGIRRRPVSGTRTRTQPLLSTLRSLNLFYLQCIMWLNGTIRYVSHPAKLYTASLGLFNIFNIFNASLISFFWAPIWGYRIPKTIVLPFSENGFKIIMFLFSKTSSISL